MCYGRPAPADVMCWQCVWSSPVAGWPAGFLNIRARLGAEPVLSRAGSPDGAQPALAAPYAGAAVAPPGRGGRRLKTREVPVCRRLPRRAARAGRLLPTLFLAAGGTGGGVEPPLACAGAARRPRTDVPGVTPGTRRYALSSASSA